LDEDAPWQLPLHYAQKWTDRIVRIEDNVDIFIWACAEVSVTIMAASIPILRSLFRELRTSSERSNQNLAPPFPQKLSSNYINIALSDRSDRSSTKPPRTPTEV